MTSPYYQDDHVTLYHGDHAEILPSLGLTFDLIVADPPYGETSLTWDRWPIGWPVLMSDYARSMWVFGSMRMFLDRSVDFASWKLSQDVVWEKHNGSSLAADRFSRVHEHALHWYQGPWAEVHHAVPTIAMAVRKTVRKKARPAQWVGATGDTTYTSEDGGPLLMPSVMFARSMHGRHPINETEKPTEILEPLISYACPPHGIVLDPFAGSCSTGVAARHLGIRSVLIERREEQCEKAARRLAAAPLDFGASA